MAYPERFWNDCSNKQRRVACFALLRNGAFESVNMHIVITLLSRFMQCWNNLHLHIQKGFKQLLVISSRDTSAGIFFCGHCAVAQPWHHSSSSEFSHAPTHQSNGLFRNEINTLKANLSVWCSLSGLVTLSSLSSKAVCVKKSTSEDKHAAGRPHLTLCHYRFSFVHTYQLVRGGKKTKNMRGKELFERSTRRESFTTPWLQNIDLPALAQTEDCWWAVTLGHKTSLCFQVWERSESCQCDDLNFCLHTLPGVMTFFHSDIWKYPNVVLWLKVERL